MSVRIVRRTSVGVRRCPAGVAAGPANWEALVGVSARVVRRTRTQACSAARLRRRWPGELSVAGLRERACHEVAALTRRSAFQRLRKKSMSSSRM